MRRKTHTKHRGLGCLLALAWVALTFVSIRLLNSCLFNREDPWEYSYAPAAEPFFDPTRFRQESGRYIYEGEAGVARATGVDVSDHQGAIDWQAVAADGIDFAMIRVGWRGNTEGYLHEDICFEQNYAGACEAGLPCGVYFFSQAVTVDEAREEATFALELLAGRELAYAVVFDYEPTGEHRIANIDGATATACTRAFCDIIAEGGYEPMIYGNRYDLGYLDAAQLSDVRVWFAEYAQIPTREEPFSLWQYTSSGSVAGIGTPVDLNLDLRAAPSTR